MFRRVCPPGQLLWAPYPLKLSTSRDCSQRLAMGLKEIQHSQSWNQQAESLAANSRQHPRAPFSRSKTAAFCQEPARIGNPYLEDAFLQGYLESRLPPKVFSEVSVDLERFGARVKDETDSLGRECELDPPRLQQFDPWGQRVDQIITCSAWKRMKEISAEEGLIAEAYERKYSSWSRVYQIAKLYLYAPSAGFFTCPLAMTDGAAKVIESLGIPEPMEEAYARLTSRDPRRFWTSGQWMTERKGGSDVANGTETEALKLPDGTYSLHGLKWFTSATDSDMTLTLARIKAAEGQAEQGSRGLSLFYLEMKDKDGKLNGIEIQRLKDKLGTRQVPTAELLLDGARAHRISAEGRGVASIASMLTITRIHNVLTAVAFMRRMIHLARDYATKREAFGKYLKEHPLHMQTLARMEVQARGAFLLMMELGRLLGLEETRMASTEDQHMLRLLTPVAKLYTAKQAVAVVSEGLECFGGQGYMEDTGLARVLRDTQVLTIWEGTTNVLALDVLRSLVKSQGKVMEAFFSTAQAKMEVASSLSELEAPVATVQRALHKLKEFLQEISSKGEAGMQLAARDFAYTLARIYGGALLLEHAARPHASATDITTAQRMIHLARDYATKREAFGKYLKEHPLHMQTLARMEVQARGAFLLMMELGRLLGLEETRMASTEDQHMLRLLTPIAKLYTAKQAVAVVSEGLECFGGQGYMEDTGLGGYFRDAQVMTIWEGTTNVLALDVLRSLVKSQGKVMEAFFSTAQAKMEVASSLSELEAPVATVQRALHKLKEFLQEISSKGEAGMQLAARDFAYTLARIYGGALLLEHAARPHASATDITTAQRWCQQDLCPVDREDKAGSYDTEAPPLNSSLIYDENPVLKGKL